MSGETFGAMLKRLRLATPVTTITTTMIGGNIRAVEHSKPLSQTALACHTRLTAGGVWRLEEEIRQPKRETVQGIAVALGLDQDDADRLLIAGGYFPWDLDAEQIEAIIRLVRGAETEAAPTEPTLIGRRVG